MLLSLRATSTAAGQTAGGDCGELAVRVLQQTTEVGGKRVQISAGNRARNGADLLQKGGP